MRIKLFAATGMVALTLAACAPAGPNQQVGALSGALIGAAAGSAFGSGAGRVGAALAGAAIGGLIGGAIGQSLDEEERRLAYDAQYDAFDSGRPRRWRGDNAYGEVIPGPAYESPEGYCREYTHTIYIDGRPQRGRGLACRDYDGTWEIVS